MTQYTVDAERTRIAECTYVQGGPKKVSHCNDSSLNRIKTRH